MAGIPMYYGIPTSGEIEAKMARDKMDVLKTQEKSIELDELMKAKDLIRQEATKKLAESKISKISPTSIPETSQGVSGYNQPATSPTPVPEAVTPTVRSADGTPMPSFNTGTAPSTASEATPMPSFMTGTKAEEAAKEPTPEAQPTQEKTAIEGYRQPQQEAAPQQQQQQVQEEAPQTPVTRVQKANLDYKEAFDQVEAAYKTADLFKQNGLLLQWQKQLKVAEDLESTRTMAQERRIKSTKDLMDMVGGIAGAYVDVAKKTNDPVELNRAWHTAMITMEANGLDTGNFKYITDPNQRLQAAEVAMNSSVEAAAKLKLEQQALQEAGRNKRAQEALQLRQDLGEKRLRQQARNSEAIQMRFDQSMDLRERQFAEGRIKTIVSQAQRDRAELNQELDDLNFKLNGYVTNQIMIDRAGNKLTKESRIQEIADIQKDINRIMTQRDEISDEIKGYELKFKDLGNAAKSKETPTKEAEPTKTTEAPKGKAPTTEDVNLVLAAIKERPEAIGQIRMNWEKLHPGFKFEDYVKVTPKK